LSQTTGALHGHRAYAHALVVTVQDGGGLTNQLHLEVVRVTVAWSPLVHVFHCEDAASAGAGRDLDTVGVAQMTLTSVPAAFCVFDVYSMEPSVPLMPVTIVMSVRWAWPVEYSHTVRWMPA
jgi:hypothetical protein